jgi:tRNA pseudouridine32 synthase / 23S rRNA pseudouridine746 synthase
MIRIIEKHECRKMKKLIKYERFEIEILYEEENVIAVNKPEGLASIHDSAGREFDLQNILQQYLNKKVLIVHRLDKEVSGVILCAKNASTHKFLNKQFEEREVKKSYIALVHGVMINESGVIDRPIREFGSGRMGVDENGKESVTHYRVIERFSSFTLVELNPTTGRRHQLRVHLYEIAHPIVGDLRYGEKIIQEKYLRLMLHAKEITFMLDSTTQLTIEAELPESFAKIIQSLQPKNY